MSQEPPTVADELLAQTEWIRGLARSLVGPEDAEDLVQDTWVATLPAGRPAGADLRAWVSTIARNLARNRFRARGRREARERATARPLRAPDTTDLVDRAELLKRIVDLLLALPELQREAVSLRYVEGLRPVDIARRLGVSDSTVRTRIHEGLARLRRDLDTEHGGDRRRWCALLAPIAGLPCNVVGDLDRGASPFRTPLSSATSMKIMVLLAAVTSVAVVPFVLQTERSARATPTEPTDVGTLSRADGPHPAGGEAAALPGAKRSVPVIEAAEQASSAEDEGAALRIQLVRSSDGGPLAGVPLEIRRLTDLSTPGPGVALGGLGYASGAASPERIASGASDPNGRFELTEPQPAGRYSVELVPIRDAARDAATLYADGAWAARRMGGGSEADWAHESGRTRERIEFEVGRAWRLDQLVSADADVHRWFCGRIDSPGMHPLNELSQAVPTDGSKVWPYAPKTPEDTSLPVVFDDRGLWCWEGAPNGDLEDVRPRPRGRVEVKVAFDAPGSAPVCGRVELTDDRDRVVLDDTWLGESVDGSHVLPLRWLEPGTYALWIDLEDHEPVVRDLTVPLGRSDLSVRMTPLPRDGTGTIEVVVESGTGSLSEPLTLSVYSTQHPVLAGTAPVLQQEIDVDGPLTRVLVDGLHRREYVVHLESAAPWDDAYVGIRSPEHRRVLADGRAVRYELLDDAPRRDVELLVSDANGRPLPSTAWLVSLATGAMYGHAVSDDGSIRYEDQPIEPELRAIVVAEHRQAQIVELTESNTATGVPIAVRLEPGRTILVTTRYLPPHEHWITATALDDVRFYEGERLVGSVLPIGLGVLTFSSPPSELRAVSDEHGELGDAPSAVLETEGFPWEIRVP